MQVTLGQAKKKSSNTGGGGPPLERRESRATRTPSWQILVGFMAEIFQLFLLCAEA
jgi:hypothetical protein